MRGLSHRDTQGTIRARLGLSTQQRLLGGGDNRGQSTDYVFRSSLVPGAVFSMGSRRLCQGPASKPSGLAAPLPAPQWNQNLPGWSDCGEQVQYLGSDLAPPQPLLLPLEFRCGPGPQFMACMAGGAKVVKEDLDLVGTQNSQRKGQCLL